MERITRQLLDHLMTAPGGRCVSIYLPISKTGADLRQAPIRLKNLIRQAESALAADGADAPEVDTLLSQAQQMLTDGSLARHDGAGLALFACSGQFHSYRLPEPVEESVSVGSGYHVTPLLPMLEGGGRFYVLALSQKSVRLMLGSRHELREVAVPGMPHSLAEVLKYDDLEKSQQQDSIGVDDPKEQFGRLCHAIDLALHDKLKGETAPLVIASVEYEAALYRMANTYPHLADGCVCGNPDTVSLTDLHAAARALAEPMLRETERKAIARYHALGGTDRATCDPRSIVEAARSGRVDQLFIARGAARFGRVESGPIASQSRSGDQDLIELAAVETLRHGGSVHPLDPENVPDGGPISAIFRY